MEKLIPLLNELHDILHKTNLQNELRLPQIVVIGSQSTGKSSLLESIIGKEILPRGKGIVTRRPCEIQLKYTPDQDQEWVEFGDRPGEQIKDFERVKKMIEEDTERVCGKNKGIVQQPIRIKFFSPNVVNLLIVDLPGITKNPVGDQPKDIEQKILQLVKPYVENENSIILAVSKGSDDLANSEGLKLARDVDPHGKRTLGVITQLDLMDQGTDALQDLMNKTYPLKLGYVGVVMRGVKEQEQITIQDQIKIEEKWFKESKIYRNVAEQMGIPYLRKKMQLSLVQHIKSSFPQIRENIVNLLQQKETEVRQYGDFEHLDSDAQKRDLILRLLQRFADSYKEIFDGTFTKAKNDELIGGSRISYIFWEIYRKTLKNIDPFDDISDQEIRTAIRNANGLKPKFFFSDGAFESLIKRQILR